MSYLASGDIAVLGNPLARWSASSCPPPPESKGVLFDSFGPPEAPRSSLRTPAAAADPPARPARPDGICRADSCPVRFCLRRSCESSRGYLCMHIRPYIHLKQVSWNGPLRDHHTVIFIDCGGTRRSDVTSSMHLLTVALIKATFRS